jgi:hypothetical protein
MLDLDDHAPRAHLLVRERLGDRVDGGAGDAATQAREPLGRRALGEARLEDRHQRVLVGEAGGEGGEARIATDLGQLHRVHEALPELLLVAEDDDPAVARGKVLRGYQRLVAGVGHAIGLPVAVQRPDREVGQHAHRGVEQRDVDVAPDAGALGVPQPGQQRGHRGVAAGEVHDRHAALARRPVGLAGDRHPARIALDQVVEGGLGRPGAGGAEAGQRAADDGGIDLAQRRVGEAELGRQIAAQVVVHGVGNTDQVVQDGLAVGMLEIEGERLLPAVERLEVERVAAGRVRPHVASDVAPDGRILDLDDLGAQVGQQLGAEGPGPELRDGDEAQAGQHCWSGCREAGS